MDKQVAEEALGSQPFVSLPVLFLAFLRLGATSFGGGTSAWTHRDIVERRKWLDEERFLQVLTVAQVMPGANPVNLAVYVGLQLRGYAGAAVAAVGMVFPAFCIILLFGVAYRQLSGHPEAQAVLRGLACVGVASTVVMGIKTARRLKGQLVPIAIAVAVFLMVGILRWPLVAVVAVFIPVSIGASYLIERRRRHG